MKQALTAGGQLLVWYAGARSALEQMGVTDIIADHTQPSLSGCHPEFGQVAVDFLVPEEGKTRMEIAFSDPQFIQDFKKSVIPEYKAVVKRVEEGYSIEEIILEQEKAAEVFDEEPLEDPAILDAEVRTALSDQPACEIWGATEALDMDTVQQGLANDAPNVDPIAQPEEAEQDEKDEDEDQEEYVEEPKPVRKKSKGKVIGIIIAAIAVVAIAAGAVFYFFVYRPKQNQDTPVDPSQQQEEPVNPDNPTDPQNPDPAPQALVTAAQYEQVQNGMTYEQVCQIFGGKEGTLLSTSSYPDEQGNNVDLQIYYWDGAGENGANASISFQGGVVLTKSSFGLQ